jgi:aryl-alcohol dehydrogenase-like predicted oxidoreductase
MAAFDEMACMATGAARRVERATGRCLIQQRPDDRLLGRDQGVGGEVVGRRPARVPIGHAQLGHIGPDRENLGLGLADDPAHLVDPALRFLIGPGEQPAHQRQALDTDEKLPQAEVSGHRLSLPPNRVRNDHASASPGVPGSLSRPSRKGAHTMIPTASLGRSGAAFTRLGLGTWAIGGPWRFGWGPVDDAESIAAIRRAVEAGINWIDTAAIYGLGHSEQIVGRALEGVARGDEVLVCTKCGRRTLPDGSPYGDLRPESIREECEASLRRLGVERIDLYQIHWPDLDTGAPLEDSWATMGELVDEGKVRWIGVSNFDAEQLERCERIRHVDSLQPPLSLLQRGALRTLIPAAAASGTGVIVYSPMASGLLSGTFDRDRLAGLPADDMRLARPEFTEPALSHTLALVERLRGIAEDGETTVAELAIAWALAQEGVTGAIVGARRPDQLEQWIGAAHLDLSDEQLQAIDEAVAETGAGTQELPTPPRPS